MVLLGVDHIGDDAPGVRGGSFDSEYLLYKERELTFAK